MFDGVIIFPFGPHEGKRIEDVPADYLNWFAGTPRIREFPDVQKWIEDNRDTIDTEIQMLQEVPA